MLTHTLTEMVVLSFLSIAILPYIPFQIFLAQPTLASPAPRPFNFMNLTYEHFLPQRGQNGTIGEELKCYSLPFGGIGFASHILTYWTVAFLFAERKPLPPFSKLRHSTWDIWIAIISLVICAPIAGFTIFRCIVRWQFVLITVWKTTMSLTLAVVGLHRSLRLRKPKNYNGKAEPSKGIYAWLVLYGLGTIVGLVGLFSLVSQTIRSNAKVRIITIVFGTVTFAICVLVICTIVLMILDEDESKAYAAGWGIGLLPVVLVLGVGILAAFYSDWILGAIASNNWTGAPSGNNTWLYWAYFAAKRLPLLSF
ncbi:hypothetical protein K469DRAFT_261765 [Zopfia rhizophila CBS 207.26]|uniref:Uncharacterized protein n=1 Tax=Zopfia rhizophila CBS 207.26 TaxID=1314779 RepID=A0A6A6DSZ2_9PEZI|nr:hypothetical protein K469DRAFT_261765 [Zopfia rhizophila CBS 207.26]